MKKKTIEVLDFYEIVKAVDKLLGYDQRSAGPHFTPDGMDFYQWCDYKGYPEKDPEGKHRGSSQIWFQEHRMEVAEGKTKDIPYMDFWHWQMHACMDEDSLHNGAIMEVYVGIDKSVIHPKPWQMEVQKAWNEVCKDEMSEDGYITCEISW